MRIENDGYEVYKKKVKPQNKVLENRMLDIIEKFFFGDPTYYYVKLFE